MTKSSQRKFVTNNIEIKIKEIMTQLTSIIKL
jgi:hypothetical protein